MSRFKYLNRSSCEDALETVDCSNAQVVSHLYEKMGRLAVSKTSAMLQRTDVAKEIVQEVFLRLWQSKNQFPNEKAVYVWIFKACHNAAIDFLRSAKQRYEDASDTPDEFVDKEFHFGDRVVSHDLIRKCLRRLPEREAQIFVYLTVDSMSYEEVAALLDISSKTVQRSVHKIERIFRKARDEFQI